MMSTKRNAIFTILGIAVLYYIILLFLQNNDWLRSFLTIGIQIIVGSIAFIWVNKAYRITPDKQRFFWLILSIGLLLHTVSNLNWFVSLLTTGSMKYPEISFFLWLVAYICFLIGLLYKVRVIRTSKSTSPYLFSIVVFTTFATSVGTYYLMSTIQAVQGDDMMDTIITLLYLICSISILFAITNLYFLSYDSKEKEVMIFIIIGFFFQVVADLYYAYLSLMGGYQIGSLVDVFWLYAILMIGSSGKFVHSNTEELDWKVINYFNNRENFLPYISTIILLILVTQSYNWKLNALSLGLSISFLMIIGRQLVIMRKNSKLVSEYRNLAYHDTLTGLKNRTAFIEDLGTTMNIARESNRPVALLLMDLDRFKTINDTLGHQIGDRVLQIAADRLREKLGCTTDIYRVGGDEFVVILPDHNKSSCSEIADNLLGVFLQPFLIDYHEISITPSIGISMYPTDGLDGDKLFKHADAAMYIAKNKGNKYYFFNAALNEIITRKMTIEIELKNAIELNQLALLYQPKINIATGEVVGMEALLRWTHPTLGQVSPVEFIPIAEESGQILSIGEWVMRKACQQNVDWQQNGFQALAVSVNVSVQQFEQDNFVVLVSNVLKETGLSAKYLELEITESIMHDIEESIQVLSGLRELGVETAIDDFGTGYSSLHILKELPISTIKIDKSFIDDIDNEKDFSIVKTIIDIGMNLNLNIIAEGIETEQQAKALLEHQCRYGQGYLYAKPSPANEFEALLSDYSKTKTV
ncbi:putative bifunctional diguanylate cyclase/phosphodiesterase [Paraliobacillus sediminis]|uniref:putative bifunctional diguanylate cyclase/phosphodiesterase n=1 Tax=Paraliobacillus sediminis TaxID=1885916 RepID=UPI000E3BDB2A|nr:EAL domain-containing protein [Paraliobacillus sediminis]